jgi:hypothetical protein
MAEAEWNLLSGVASSPVDIGRRRRGIRANKIAKIMFERMRAVISDVPYAVTQKHCRLQYSDVGQLLRLSETNVCTRVYQAKCNADCSRILRYLGAKVNIHRAAHDETTGQCQDDISEVECGTLV